MIFMLIKAAVGFAGYVVALVKERRTAARIEERLQNITRQLYEQAQRDAERDDIWLGRPAWARQQPARPAPHGLSRPVHAR